MRQQIKLFSVENKSIAELLRLDESIYHIDSVAGMLEWDQEVNMPSGSAEARTAQLTELKVVLHSKRINPKIAELLGKLEDEIRSGQEFTPYDRALIRVMHEEYDSKTKIPLSLIEELSRATSSGTRNWIEARRKSDFGLFKDDLKKIVALKIREAECLGYQDSPYDPLLNQFEPGFTVRAAEPIFAKLRDELIGIVSRSSDTSEDYSFLNQKIDSRLLDQFGREVLTAMGFNFAMGRLDISTHPFTIGLHPTDIRITTRYTEPNFTESLFSIFHEGGHGLYEQGVDLRLAATTLGRIKSIGIHESQSRLWENNVARSTSFWKFWYPKLSARVLSSGCSLPPLATFLRAINRINPGTIRVSADEVTYNLHIIVRFEIEKMLLAGELKAEDVPIAWNEKMEKYLGVKPRTDAGGCLQDVHWSNGLIGYFPTYALGNIFAAQLMHTINKEFPDLNERIESGNLQFLQEWLRRNIHEFGNTYSSADLIKQVTGEELNPTYFTNYLQQKLQTFFG
ncbi:MAG: carboxypeptidase M32 [Candidatus Harrisonbacteria bacterium]|nr:carboxypeptidase M32 [Candidatus Harrisonbacteria bacterium]